jgi:ketosteroid isomerase-like protein
MSAANKRVIGRHFAELLNLGDLLVVDEIYAPTYVRHAASDPAGGPGPESEKNRVVMLRTALSDLCATVEDMVAEGDRVAVRWTLLGIDTGGFSGRPPTGRPVTLTGLSIVRLVEGRIVESWEYVDRLDLLQLGGDGLTAVCQSEGRI